MSDPVPTPVTETVPPVTPEEVAVARKFARARTFVKKSLTTVGVPVLIGAVAATVVARRKDSDVEETTEDDTLTEE